MEMQAQGVLGKQREKFSEAVGSPRQSVWFLLARAEGFCSRGICTNRKDALPPPCGTSGGL